MIALKISVFCAKAEVERIQFASTFACQFMWWLKFQYKHVTLLIYCQFNRTVSLAVSGCFHVHFPTEELRLICLLAVIDKNDGCSKISLFFCVFNSSNQWTFCTGHKFPQVDRGFFTNIFPFLEIIIYSLHTVGKWSAIKTVKMKITIACLHTQFEFTSINSRCRDRNQL